MWVNQVTWKCSKMVVLKMIKFKSIIIACDVALEVSHSNINHYYNHIISYTCKETVEPNSFIVKRYDTLR